MEELIKLQEDLKNKIERGLVNYKKSPKDRLTDVYCQTRLETLEQQWKLFTENHIAIIKDGTSGEEHFEQYTEEEIYEMTEDIYIEYKSALRLTINKFLLLSQNENVKNVNNSNVDQCNSFVKLPEICIPKFSGKYSEWQTFKDMFTSLIHNNSNLGNVQKIHYLKGYLTGEAEQLIRQIPVSADNYERAWSLLNERFNNKKYMSHCIIKRLLSQRNLQRESASGLKDLVDTTNDCLDGLKNLNIDVTNWDILIIHILALKLDQETKRQWEIHVSSNVDSDSLPTYEQFKVFMTQRYRALEFIEPNKINKDVKVDNVQGKLKAFHVTKYSCVYCGQEHKISYCSQFLKINVDHRRDFVQQKRLCFNCLGVDHSARECKITTHCKICGRLHHTLLHLTGSSAIKNKVTEKSGKEGEVKDKDGRDQGSSAVVGCALTEEASGASENITSCFSENKTGNQVLLATAVVKVEANNGSRKLIRALIDQGSQASFVTESTVQFLGLKKTHTKNVISGLGGDKKIISKSMVNINFESRFDNKIKFTVKAYVLSKITAFLPSRKVVGLEGLDLTGLKMADPEYHTPNKIDILLGADVYGQLLQEGLRKNTCGGIIAQATALGWIVSGTVSDSKEHSSNVVVMHSVIEENEILKKFWELENDPKEKDENWMNEEEMKCEELYRNTVKRDETGRYIVKIPFKVEKPQVQDSFKIAEKRFHLLEERFKKNKILKTKFSEVMDNYLSAEHMELVKDDEVNNPDAVYVPILAVIRADKDTTQVRVVCDSSCKGKDGISINDLMMKGPVLQDDLRHLLMRWRMHVICLVADIAKMYLQIKVTKPDTDYQRLLWRPDPSSAVQVYRMLRVSFGTASAPYLAVRTLQQLAYDEGEKYPLAKIRTLNDFYMDDMMTGCNTPQEAVEIYNQMNDLLKKGGFVLRKWSSNKDEVLKEIEKRQGTGDWENSEDRNFNIKLDAIMKILGLTWDRREDEFRYSVEVSELGEPVTKRKILSEVARLFDPLGWLSPCIILAKILIQKLWLKGLEWDEPIPADIYKQWVTYRNELPRLKEFRIPRWMGTTKNCHIQLHGFADASNVAYAAVVYARITDDENNVRVVLLTAKTKVCPIKIVSIPRLELCGAVLLTKLLKEVARVLAVDKNDLYAWTDSTVVLAWLNSHPRRWKPFIANRVSDIITSMEPSQWSHVKSKENPADVASRGLNPSEILDCEIWKNGPEFLREKELKIKHNRNLDTDIEEIKVHHMVTEEDDTIWKRFSSLNRLVRVIAYCKRFTNLIKNKENKPKFESYLTSKELSESLNTLIRKCQEEHFKEEIKDLNRQKEIKNKSKIAHLNPYLDGNSLLRVGGRLENSKLTQDEKHPIILPKDSTLSKLIVEEAHKKLLHGGQQLVLGYLRSRYWIIGVKLLVKGIIRKCVTCIRHSGVTRNQLMGQLPEARVTPARAFLNSGVDFAGPINIRTSKGRGHHAYKGYICLFICMATRAVHLEAVSDLTAQGFIAAFRRFVSRRGHCLHIWSDNGTNFVGASKELCKLFSREQSLINSEIRELLANNNTTWHFIPPYSPNFGGLWEAGIKSSKFHLKRVIGDSTLTYEELSTVLAQIEACLNSRPLSRIDTDGDTYTVLTPGHFLVGEPLITIPDQNFETCTLSTLKRWQVTQRMLQSFWSKWSREYLHYYLQRYKWSKHIPEPKVGDVVLVKELDLPPARWLIGKILEKHPGLDGITRVVTLKAKNTVFKRPVSKLCVLPTEK